MLLFCKNIFYNFTKKILLIQVFKIGKSKTERRNNRDRRKCYDLDYFRKNGIERRKCAQRRDTPGKLPQWFKTEGTKRVLIRRSQSSESNGSISHYGKPGNFTSTETLGAERRRHLRHLLTGGVIARPKMTSIYGNVRDISLGGLAFRYGPKGSSMIEAFEMDIFLRGNGFNLQGVPFKTVSDLDIREKDSFITKHIRQRGVKFLNISPLQLEKLNYLINYHSIGPA